MSTPDVTAYAAQVRAALADLPAQQRLELLEDLEDHLAEVAADTAGPLEARLGPATDYARDLRFAALAPQSAERSGRLQRALADLRTDALRLWQLDAVREARAFLPELRPAWWVLRAALPVAAVGVVLGSPLLLPLGLLGLPLLVAAIVVSVRLGRRAAARPAGTGSRWAVVANTALALLAVVFVVGVQQETHGPVYAEYAPYGPYGDEEQTLRHDDGTPITNLYPFTSDGEPLQDVLLYDQEGRPVDNLSTTTFDGAELRPLVVPGQPPAPSNRYPQAQEVLEYDGSGTLAPRPLQPSPSSTPSASPSSARSSPAPAPAEPAPAEPPPAAPAEPAPPGAP